MEKNMNFRQLEYIIAIADEGNITKASMKMYITQSALNQQLLKLEKELGVQLFVRRSHAMTPTFAGKIYLSSARRMLDMKNETYKIIHDIADEQVGEISLAYTPERGSILFSEIYPKFHRMYPGITFDIHESRVRGMETLLSQHMVDIAFMSHIKGAENPDFVYDDYHTEHMVLGVPLTNPLSKLAGEDSGHTLPPVDIRLFRNECFVLMNHETLMRTMIDSLFQDAGFHPDVLFESSSTRTLFNMAAQQICSAFFPESYVDPAAPIAYFSIPQNRPYASWVLSAVHANGTYLTASEKYLIFLAKENSVLHQNDKYMHTPQDKPQQNHSA